MNKEQQVIIKALAGRSSTDPMTSHHLFSLVYPDIKSHDVFCVTCDSLYEARIINRCYQSKGGVEQYLYWPTANISNKAPPFIINHKRHLDATLTPSPRRSELAKQSTDTSKDEAMSKTKKDAKYTAILVVETALKHPGIKFGDLVQTLTGDDIERFGKARDMVYYCVNNNFLKRDKNKVLSLGSNDAWLIKNGFMQDSSKPLLPEPTRYPQMPEVQPPKEQEEEFTSKNAPEQKRHRWDSDGERCLDCGDKDWFAESVCKPKVESKNIIQEIHLGSEHIVKAIENNLIESKAESAYIPKEDFFVSIASLHIEHLFKELPNNSTLQMRVTESGDRLIHITTPCVDTALKLEDVNKCFEAISTLNRLQAA